MADAPRKCEVPTCERGPCRIASRFALLDAGEVPEGCPNRLVLRDAEFELPRLLMHDDLYISARAGAVLSTFHSADRLHKLLGPTRAGRLVLLHMRYRPELRAGSLARTKGQTPQQPPPVLPQTKSSWIEFVLLDKNGEPAAGETYRVVLTDGQVKTGKLNSRGSVRFDEIDPGTCQISFPELNQKAS